MPDLDKATVRRRLRAARAALEDRAARQAALDAALRALPHLGQPLRAAASFRAMPDEASPDALDHALRERGVQIAYPRVDGRRLVFAFAAPEALRPGTMGILEPPPEAPEVPLGDFDLFIVPGVGFTRAGGRIGYGGGYYDRTLAAARAGRAGRPPAPAVGVAFDLQIVSELPLEAHDVVLDGLITERGFAESTPDPEPSPPRGTP